MKSIKSMLIILTMLFAVSFVPTAFASEPGIQAFPVVNVNTANAQELSEALIGVGMRKAEAIVKSREKEGLFKTVDDLTRVKGIGDSIVEKNRDRVRLGDGKLSMLVGERATK